MKLTTILYGISVVIIVVIMFSPFIIKKAMGDHADHADHEYQSLPRPRFQHLLTEDIKNPTDTEGNDVQLVVLRDTETGQEVVCAMGAVSRFGRTGSCYLTGRKW